jgi:trehalose 6-phosphate phosphatase
VTAPALAASLPAALAASLPAALVALDFDGTLTPISPHPDDARPLPDAITLLRDLRATGAAVAVVTGRSVASLLRLSGFGDVPGLVIYGTHGVERWEAGELRAPPAPPGLDELRQSLPGLLAGLTQEPDLWIEDKKLSLVIHARLTPDPDAVLEQLEAPVRAAAAAAGLGVRPGKEVLEICIPGIDKGTALHELLVPGTSAACYAGDDLGDLPAFTEVKAWAQRTGRPSLTIGVGPEAEGPIAGTTDVSVPDPQHLIALLRQLVEIRADA